MMRNLLHKISFKENKRRYLNVKGITTRRYAYKGPDVVQIDLTNHCNSNCLICWIHASAIKNNADIPLCELDCATVKGFISDVACAGTKEIIFSGGGEPFFYPHFWEILEFSERVGLDFRINTNFTLMDTEKINRLLSFNKLTSLTVSVWAADPQLYSKLHNRDIDCFDKVKNNLTVFNTKKTCHPKVTVFAVMNSVNYSQLNSLIDFVSETGCDALELGVPDVIPGVTDTCLLNTTQLKSLEQQFTVLYKYLRYKKCAVKIMNKDIFLRRIMNPQACYGEYDSPIDTIPCYAGWVFLRLRANGDFNSCLKSHRIPSGNIHKDSFSSVWNNSLQQEFRMQGLSIPKDKNFFSPIGNGNNGEIGCRRICDNLLVNRNLHRVLKYLFWI